MCSGCRVCSVTQLDMLSSCVPWKVRPKSTKRTIYARVAAAKLLMNLRLRDILSECDARSETHSPKDSNFRRIDFAVMYRFPCCLQKCPHTELCDKMRFKIIGVRGGVSFSGGQKYEGMHHYRLLAGNERC